MSSNGTVSSFRFDGAIWALKDRGHKTERSITLSNDIRLNITIVVLTGPQKSTARFDSISNHIIDESMLIPESSSIELCFIVSIVNFLEDIFESTIVFLHNSVLGGQVAWVVSDQRIFEAFVGKSSNRFVSIVHSHKNTWAFKVVNLESLCLGTIFWSENNLEFTWSINNGVSSSVLITESMSSDNDWLGPSWNKLWNILAEDWFSENSSSKIVSDSTVW